LDGTLCMRGGRTVAWAADFIFLDLSFGGSPLASPIVPLWGVCSENHGRVGMQLAYSSLSDSGWLLIMVSMAGFCFIHNFIQYLSSFFVCFLL
ncbi:hypothetical protein, partial [Enterobacter cloacae complex sp. CH23B]|uniref:hypothetical protein n=1 Tax=Enterobacter cloacae complex sp. CH23B TaxID=2511986 RepID=UPI001CA5EDEC